MYPNKNADTGGFTLVELLVGIFVTMLIVGVASTAFVLQNRASSVQQGTSEMQLDGQVIMELLERDIRMAGYHIDDKSSSLATPPDDGTGPKRKTGTSALRVDYVTGANVSNLYFIEDGIEGRLARLDLATAGAVPETIASNIEDMRITITQDPVTGLPIVDVALLIRSTFNDPKFTSAASFAVMNSLNQTVILNANTAQYPNCKRRAYTTTVRPRNFGL